MGNIEIKERPSRHRSIFRGQIKSRSRSPFQEIVSPKSPYYKDFSPIRYSQQNQQSIKKATLNEEATFTPIKHRQQGKIVMGSKNKQITTTRRESNWNDNREKCQQIIKKVRNFNDFLLQLKKKLRQDCALQKKQNNQKGAVSMSVKLENQRVQLQKYKKLVERQLSKTHSISSIDIQSLKNGEKMLTIQYENLGQSQEKTEDRARQFAQLQNKKHQQPKLFDPDSNSSIQTAQQYRKTPVCELINPDYLYAQKSIKKDSLRQIKYSLAVLKKQCKELGKNLTREQQNSEQYRDSMAFLSKCKQKTERINKLFGELELENNQSRDLQRKIRNLIL